MLSGGPSSKSGNCEGKMKASAFQFTNPSIIYIKFIENNGFQQKKNEDIEISAGIEIKQGKINGNECSVNAIVTVGEESDAVPFLIEIEITARFRWNLDEKERLNIDAFLEQNAPSLLISYVRPIIAMITDASHYPAYHLPFINMAGQRNNKI